MTWSVKTKPHYRVVYKCGHTKERCACTGGRVYGKRSKRTQTGVVDELCPDCAAKAKEHVDA